MRKRKNLNKKNENYTTNNSSIVTRSVAKGVIVLVFLLLLGQSTYFLVRVVKEIKETNKLVSNNVSDTLKKLAYISNAKTVSKSSEKALSSAIVKTVVAKNAKSSKMTLPENKHKIISKNLPFKFDPNLSTMSELMRLGFSPKQAAVILRWREAGGSFHSKEDFKKMYVVSDSVYERLEPYIIIMPNSSDIVDVNSADSARLVSIRGIGPYYAKAILKYRGEIGYYAKKEQLMEIYGINQDVYDKIQAYIKVSTPSDSIKKLHYNIFNFSLGKLAANPYIGSYSARGIDRYRRTVKDSSKFTINGLLKNGVITQDQAQKLKYYSK